MGIGKSWIGLTAGAALLASAALWPGERSVAQRPKVKGPVSPTFAKDVRPIVQKYCVSCHHGASAPGGIDLSKFTTEALAAANSEVWDKVATNVGSMHMPPAGMATPTKAQRTALVAWVQSMLSSCKLASPGRVTMRRLNRMEYDDTIRDLTGLDLHLSNDFPNDDVGYGFDNIGDVLSISPLQMEKYLRAAEKVAKEAIVVPSAAAGVYEGEKLKATGGGNQNDEGGWTLFSNGSIIATHDFAHTGTYRIKVKAYGDQAGPEPPKMAVSVDKDLIDTVPVKAVAGKPEEYQFPIRVEAGKHTISASFTNDYYVPGPPPQDRNLIIDAIEVVQPTGDYDALPDSHKRIIPKSASGKPPIREVFKAFATKAYRRPVTAVELDRLTQMAGMVMKDGESYERAVQIGVQAILSSPNFLFRVEREDGKANVGPYELASRLSYFLWGSMPDDRLFALAASGEIEKPAVLQSEAKRMLADPRSKALSDGFAAQWLNLRKLNGMTPDPTMFPDFNDQLRNDMATETRMFFDGVVRNDRSVLDLLGGRYSFLNERLAKYYGIAGVTGDEFRKVSLDGTPRGGVLTQASILTLTSNPTRTSPVKRGKWVLEQLFNQGPPPPPPGVGDLGATGKQLTGTLRQKMEQHRENPACANCHKGMDPIGFSLENFDATGKWRTTDAGAPVDASGVLPDGTKFNGPNELRSILMQRKDQFVRCLSEKMVTYAIGRGVESADRCYIDRIATSVRQNQYRFSSLVTSIVTSEPFRFRRVTTVVAPKSGSKASKGAK